MVNNNTLRYRVELLEKNYAALDLKMDSILTNHIPHIREDIATLRTRITIATAINVGAMIAGILIARVL